LNKYAGYVSLKINLPDNYFAGVAYRRPVTDEQFGTMSTDTNVTSTDTLILKMIKVANLIPQDLLAWEMKLKNIYQLPKTNISEQGFEFRILYHPPNFENFPIFPNMSTYIITILGLDKYTSGRTGPPDNKFDFLPGYTIDQSNGWIIFPTLKPLLSNLQNYNPPIDSAYWYPQIYDEIKSNSTQAPNANNYLFTGYISH
jgi:cell surface protein SprA